MTNNYLLTKHNVAAIKLIDFEEGKDLVIHSNS